MKRNSYLFLLPLLALAFFSCTPQKPKEKTAQELLKQKWAFVSVTDSATGKPVKEISPADSFHLFSAARTDSFRYAIAKPGITARGTWAVETKGRANTLVFTYTLKPIESILDSAVYNVDPAGTPSITYYNDGKPVTRAVDGKIDRVVRRYTISKLNDSALVMSEGPVVYTFRHPVIVKAVEPYDWMSTLRGLLGYVLIFGIAVLLSNNRKAINYRLVFSGLLLQVVIAVLVLKVPPVTAFFQQVGKGMAKIEHFAKEGANFVYGGIANIAFDGTAQDYRAPGAFVFAFNITATIILVCIIVAMFYHWGIMQRIVSVIAKAMNFIMRVSGAEALSNVASAFVGQVEAQVMIRPYLAGMTKSELLASMTGSLACIAGGILVVYVNMGSAAGFDLAPKLIAASLMAAPGALVISKIVYPETEQSQTLGNVKLEVKSSYTNLIDAITHGAGDGFKIAMNVIAMLIGFIALIALINWMLGHVGHWIDPQFTLSLDWIFGKLFYPFAWSMGVPDQDVANVATLLGQKLTVNEFVAFQNLTTHQVPIVTEKGLMIVSVAICGFANFSSVGMQIGGIGALAPERRSDLARLGMKALVCGTLASYLSATIAGMLY